MRLQAYILALAVSLTSPTPLPDGILLASLALYSRTHYYAHYVAILL